MSDRGKSDSIRTLRREVGFGCPICRNPFLTWHHFDPPWHVEKHWRPEGIIALCLGCHASADGKGGHPGAYSADELRRLKTSPRSLDDVKAQFFDWRDKENLLVRVGGLYSGSGAPIISANGEPQIAIRKNEDGLMSLSFRLRDRQDSIVAEMQENWLTVPPAKVQDMTAQPKTKGVKVWLAESEVGVEFSFRRINPTELEAVLQKDRERSGIAGLASRAELRPRWPRPDNLPEHIWEAHYSDDPTGSFVKHWVKEKAMDSDGLIPFLDFEQMAINFNGRRIEIKNGISGQITYSAAFENGTGAINLS